MARLLAIKIFEALAALANERGCELVLVHLPIESEYAGGSADVLRLYFRSESQRLGIHWIDLFDEFRALSPEVHASLYLRKPALGAGHYNAQGHELVAELIARKLHEFDPVRARFNGLR